MATPAQNPAQKPNPPAGTSSSRKLLFIAIAVIIVLLAGAALWKLKAGNLSNVSPTPTPTSQKSGTLPVISTTNWQSFTIKALGLQFKLPPDIASKGTLSEEIVDMTKVPGDKGTMLCIHFRKNRAPASTPTPSQIQRKTGCMFSEADIFTIGGSSNDASIAGSVYITEMQGFRADVATKKFYLVTDRKNNKGYTIAEKLMYIIINPSLSTIALSGRGLPSSKMVLFENFTSDSLVGILNTTRSDYSGIIVQTSSTNINENTFNAMLKTVKKS